MYLPKTCFAGRIIIRDDGMGGLNWTQPCPVPPEEMLPFTPPMYFCVPHYDVLVDELYETLDRDGLIDHDLVTPPDEFDMMVRRLVLEQ